jgi:hypothetical protein
MFIKKVQRQFLHKQFLLKKVMKRYEMYEYIGQDQGPDPEPDPDILKSRIQIQIRIWTKFFCSII